MCVLCVVCACVRAEPLAICGMYMGMRVSEREYVCVCMEMCEQEVPGFVSENAVHASVCVRCCTGVCDTEFSL